MTNGGYDIMKITKTEIIKEIAKESQNENKVTIAQVYYVVTTFLDKIIKYTDVGSDVIIRKFGKFQKCEKKPRHYKSPNGKHGMSDEKSVLVFKTSPVITKKKSVD